jgi:hypothetical protein
MGPFLLVGVLDPMAAGLPTSGACSDGGEPATEEP